MTNGYLTNKLVPVDYDPFFGPAIAGIAPVIESQAEIWASCQIGGADASRAYNESVSLLLQGKLDYAAMASALQEIVQRYEALRAAFSTDGMQMCFYNEWPLQIQYEDIEELDDLAQQAFLADHNKQNAGTSFDLVHGPLFRTALFKLGPTTHHLTITAHHIICDGWSLGILLQDISQLYAAHKQGLPPTLPPAESFRQYAEEQQAFLHTNTYKDNEQYWLSQYKDHVPILNLPTDYPRPAVRTYKSHRVDYALAPELVTAIKALGATEGCSLVTTILSAFEVYLHRLTGQHDIVLGLPAACQAAAGKYNLVGHCVNLLPLRSTHVGETTFAGYLRQRRSEILNAYEHQQFTFGTLLKKLNIARDPSRVPLVPIAFNIDMGLDNGVDFPGLEHQLLYNPREYESFEIFLNATGAEKSMRLEWSYNTQLFKHSTIKRMMEAFETLLKSVVLNPALKIKDIPLTAPHLLEAKLSEWNDTQMAYPKDIPLNQLFIETVQKYPAQVALQQGVQNLTYKALQGKATQLAAFLQQSGISRGDIVAVVLDRSPDVLISLLAILQCGAAYLPLDPEYPQGRIEFMLADSRASILLTAKPYMGRFKTNATTLLVEEAWTLPDTSPTFKAPLVKGHDLAYVLYTSGSTGQPKAVQITHSNLVNFLCSMQKTPGIHSADRLLAITTISFDIAGLELFLPLLAGATVVLADTAITKDGRLLLDTIQQSGITILQATPATWRMLLEAGWQTPLPLKALCGGEAMPKDLAQSLLTRCSSLWNMYGPTETTIWSTIKQIQPGNDPITIGRPINNTQVYILDEYLNALPEGTEGELYIAGDGVAKGYLNHTELTADKFVPNPFSADKSAKMYRTGDLGRFQDNGELLCLGRMDQQVKIRGYRIEPGEVEYWLQQQEEIQQAVVVARHNKLVAYVVPDAETYPEDHHIQRWKQKLNHTLPPYMVPSEFLLLPKLPLTSNGKIDPKALPDPGLSKAGQSKNYAAPKTNMEKLIASIWADLLGLEKIGIYDDFFELGGHSLIAFQAMARLEKETGKRLPLASLFEAPTVEKLALMVVDEHMPNTWNSLIAIKTEGNKTPLFIVHGFDMNVLVFKNIAMHMDPDQPVYALQAKGLDAADEPAEKLETIAGHYISEILTHVPGNSYALAGYSFGGIIALEMAKQLKAMGKDIKMLAMMDTYAEASPYYQYRTVRLLKKIWRQLPKCLFILGNMFKYPKETFGYQGYLLRRKLGDWHILKPLPISAFYEDEEKIAAKYDYAQKNYKLTPYTEGVIDLFKVKIRLYYLDDPRYLGWRPYAPGGLYIHYIPGDHKTSLLPPNDKIFAGILQKTLNNRTQLATNKHHLNN